MLFLFLFLSILRLTSSNSDHLVSSLFALFTLSHLSLDRHRCPTGIFSAFPLDPYIRVLTNTLLGLFLCFVPRISHSHTIPFPSYVTISTDIKKPASASEVKKDANDLSETFRTLVSLALDQAKILKREATQSGSGILGDLVLLSRDLLADAAEEVSSLADEAAKELRPQEGDDGKVSKEDLKNKGKQVQEKAKQKTDEAKQRLQKEKEPVQGKAVDAKDKAVDRLVEVSLDSPTLCLVTELTLVFTYRSPSASKRTQPPRRLSSSCTVSLASTTKRRGRQSKLPLIPYRSTGMSRATSTPSVPLRPSRNCSRISQTANLLIPSSKLLRKYLTTSRMTSASRAISMTLSNSLTSYLKIQTTLRPKHQSRRQVNSTTVAKLCSMRMQIGKRTQRHSSLSSKHSHKLSSTINKEKQLPTQSPNSERMLRVPQRSERRCLEDKQALSTATLSISSCLVLSRCSRKSPFLGKSGSS